MTIFGPDISSYEHGVNVSQLTDPFVFLKCTEGTYYADADYPAWLAQAKAAHKIVVAYHFVKADETAGAQAAWMAQHILDKSIPVMLDVEPEGSSKPDVTVMVQVADAMEAVGLRVKLAYFPKWYWEQTGSQSLHPLADRGIGLVSSAYPHVGAVQPISGYFAAGGDSGVGWGSYGGVAPLLWQYTDAGLEQQKLDFNAFKGTVAELAAFLGAAHDTTGGIMALTQQDAQAVWSYSHGDVPDVHQTLDNAAKWAGQANDKLDQVLKALVPVDVSALANQIVTSLEQHFASGVDAQAIAQAVQSQLAQALSSHGAG